MKKWHKILEKIQEESSREGAAKLSAKSSIRMASKKFLINKKRQLLDKMSRRTSKTINDISHSCGEISRSVSKLYTNVPPPGSHAAKKGVNDTTADKDMVPIDFSFYVKTGTAGYFIFYISRL